MALQSENELAMADAVGTARTAPVSRTAPLKHPALSPESHRSETSATGYAESRRPDRPSIAADAKIAAVRVPYRPRPIRGVVTDLYGKIARQHVGPAHAATGRAHADVLRLSRFAETQRS